MLEKGYKTKTEAPDPLTYLGMFQFLFLLTHLVCLLSLLSFFSPPSSKVIMQIQRRSFAPDYIKPDAEPYKSGQLN